MNPMKKAGVLRARGTCMQNQQKISHIIYINGSAF